jgi:hypothetical protein
VDGRGREGRPLRRVLDRLEAERGHDSGGAHLLDAAAERLDLLDQHLERAARAESGVEIGRQHDAAPEEREPPALPPGHGATVGTVGATHASRSQRRASRAAPRSGGARLRVSGAPRLIAAQAVLFIR